LPPSAHAVAIWSVGSRSSLPRWHGRGTPADVPPLDGLWPRTACLRGCCSAIWQSDLQGCGCRSVAVSRSATGFERPASGARGTVLVVRLVSRGGQFLAVAMLSIWATGLSALRSVPGGGRAAGAAYRRRIRLSMFFGPLLRSALCAAHL